LPTGYGVSSRVFDWRASRCLSRHFHSAKRVSPGKAKLFRTAQYAGYVLDVDGIPNSAVADLELKMTATRWAESLLSSRLQQIMKKIDTAFRHSGVAGTVEVGSAYGTFSSTGRLCLPGPRSCSWSSHVFRNHRFQRPQPSVGRWSGKRFSRTGQRGVNTIKGIVGSNYNVSRRGSLPSHRQLHFPVGEIEAGRKAVGGVSESAIRKMGVPRRRLWQRVSQQLADDVAAWCAAFFFQHNGDWERWCGRRESNPHRPLSPADFHAVYGFRRPDAGAFQALPPGLRSGLSLHPPPDDPGLRCRPSSLYTFPAEVFRPSLARDCHPGFRRDKFKVSPNLGGSASPVSQASTQVFPLSPLRLPFRHTRVAGHL